MAVEKRSVVAKPLLAEFQQIGSFATLLTFGLASIHCAVDSDNGSGDADFYSLERSWAGRDIAYFDESGTETCFQCTGSNRTPCTLEQTVFSDHDEVHFVVGKSGSKPDDHILDVTIITDAPLGRDPKEVVDRDNPNQRLKVKGYEKHCPDTVVEP